MPSSWADSRQGLNSSSSSITYAPIVPSENATIRPSPPSCSTLIIPMSVAMERSVLLNQTANCPILLTLEVGRSRQAARKESTAPRDEVASGRRGGAALTRYTSVLVKVRVGSNWQILRRRIHGR
jgi:hypothetical protein